MAQISSRKCDSCETETGKLYCYECKQFLCDPCKRFHDKFQKKHTTTDSHNVDRLTLSQQLTCEQHKEDFVHFCSSCECLTCSLCDTSAHQGHSLTQISEVVSQARENVRHLIDQLKKNIKTLTEFIESIKTTKLQKLKSENKQYSSEVETTSEQIIFIVKTVKDINLTRASDFLVLEKQQLEFFIAKLEKIYNEHTSLSSQLEQVLQLKHDVAFFLNQKTIIKQIEDLDDIPCNIEEPNEIGQFNKENFAKAVVKQIQSQYNIEVEGDLEHHNVYTLQLKNDIRALEEKYKNEKTKTNELSRSYDKAIKEIEHNSKEELIGTLKEDVSRLQGELDEKEKQMAELNSEISQLKSRSYDKAIKEIEHNSKEELIGTLKEDVSRLQGELEEKEKQMAELNSEISQLKSRRVQQTQLVTALKEENDILRRDLEHHNVYTLQLKKEYRVLEKKYKNEKTKTDELSRSYDKALKEIEHNSKEELIGTLKEDVSRLQGELDEKEKHMAELNSDICQLKSRDLEHHNVYTLQLKNDIRALEEKYKNEKTKTDELSRSYDKAIKEIEHNSKEELIGTLKEDVSRLQGELDEKEKQMAELNSEISQLKSRDLEHHNVYTLQLKNDYRALEEKYENEKTKTDEISRSYDKAIKEIEHNSKEELIGTLKEDVLRLQGELDEKEKQMAELNSEISQLKSRGREVLESRSLTDDDRIDELQEQLRVAKYIAEDADRKYDEAARKWRVADTELERTEEKYEDMRRQVKQLEQDLHETSTSLREFEIREEKATYREDSYDETIRDLTNRLKDAEARMDISERQCNSLQRKNEKLQEDLDNEQSKRIATEQEMERTLAELSAF